MGEALDRPRRLKVYGERNTGTRWLEQLLEQNLDTEIIGGSLERFPQLREIIKNATHDERGKSLRDQFFAEHFATTFGWKHTMAPDAALLAQLDTDGVAFVILTKNPYSWLVSLHRRPYHYKGDLGQKFHRFLKRPWVTRGRERGPVAFDHPVAIWNEKNRSYLRMGEAVPLIHITYEELLADTQNVVDSIGHKLGVQRRPGPFRNLLASTKRGRHGRNRDYAFFQDYYLNERWKNEYKAKTLAWVNAHLDFDLMKRFGYPRWER